MLSRLAILIFAALPMLAQSTGTATVVGTVTDSTGAVVPGVRITVRNIGQQIASEGRPTPMAPTTFRISPPEVTR